MPTTPTPTNLKPYRQGIISNPPNFLVANGATVNLVIPLQPLLIPVKITFADQDADYLIVERLSINSAWVGPFAAGTNYYLYWDLDVKTGALTRGFTTLAPYVGLISPPAPANNQHWFDTTTNVQYVWRASGSRWVRVIRVFAAMYNGSFVSLSDSSPAYAGTQVGSIVSSNPGAIVFDGDGNPIKRLNDTFFTTVTLAVTGVSSSAQVKLSSIILEGEAQTSISAYSIVKFISFGKFIAAPAYDNSPGVYGIIEQDVVVGDVVSIYTEGVITNFAWNWSALTVGTPLYVVGEVGQLSDVKIGDAVVIAVVLDENTLYFKPIGNALAHGKMVVAEDITPLMLSSVRSNRDSHGIYTTLELSRLNGTLFKRSILSGGVSPEYTNRTETIYRDDGTTLLYTTVYRLTYVSGEFTSEINTIT